ncbi:MAG: SDR family NAD(P)-dependent oxidoreductase [Cellulomonadaceae bacterium]|jgi:NAD(P)-dependent dehydrogenase (short-subunit alcohol dehydrogenase family)|nr:SDR family NAD(P)-dependent oxidoreductase [Cellulomonadaceae bacterium]
MSKTVVITGASSGIGAAAARQLHADGHQVVLVGRDAEKTNAIADELGVPRFLADYTRLEDVRRLASALSAAHPGIQVLLNNAGAMFGKYELTEDGFERTFQVNHLAPALLTRMLGGLLVANRANVVWTSSRAIKRVKNFSAERLGIDDAQARSEFEGMKAYGNAKLASTILMKEMDRRYRSRGLGTIAVHPGVIATNFGAHTGHLVGRAINSPVARVVLAKPQKGAQRLVDMVEGKAGIDWHRGTYVENGIVVPRAELRNKALGTAVWDRTEELLTLIVE